MGMGLWVSRRRRVQAWMLRHHTPTLAVTAPVTPTAPHRPARTANPGPAVTITAPTPGRTTTGGTPVSSTPEEIAEMYAAFLDGFEPESVADLTNHFQAFAPMMEAFCSATAKHAERLRDEYGITGGLTEMVTQFGSAFGGMCDMAEEVVTSWQSEHAADIERTENPRPGEEQVWNYHPGQ
jgi:hypothetical protein